MHAWDIDGEVHDDGVIWATSLMHIWDDMLKSGRLPALRARPAASRNASFAS